MNLKNKKTLAAKVLGVGKNRIQFNPENLKDIKEAITKQDIRELYEEGIINVKPTKGRKKVIKRKRRRGPGKIKNKVKNRKQDYVRKTVKFRKYLKNLKRLNKISTEDYHFLRKKIKMKAFRDMTHFKEHISSLNILQKTDLRKTDNFKKNPGDMAGESSKVKKILKRKNETKKIKRSTENKKK